MHEYRVKQVLNVVDADTFDLRISLGFGMEANLRFRLHGVDAPEVYGRNASDAGRGAKAFVEQWMADRNLCIQTYKGSAASVGLGDGSFGRWLADVFDTETGEALATALVEQGHVVEPR